MSDDAPPNYDRDFGRCFSWREKVFEEMNLELTLRHFLIFEHAARTVAFAYENNRENHYSILIETTRRLINDGCFAFVKT